MWLICLGLAILLVSVLGKEPKYIDPFCTLTGVPSRDPGETERIYLRRQNQTCSLVVPSTEKGVRPTVGRFRYVRCGKVTTYCTWRVQNAVIRISASNLDNAVPDANKVSYQYIHRIDDSVSKNGVVRQILGKKLGGSGIVLQNLFAASEGMKPSWEAIENKVYDCLKSSLATFATLRWYFYYRTDVSSRPYKVHYEVEFAGSDGSPSQCANIDQHIDN